MFVRMPDDGGFPVSLLDDAVSVAFLHAQDLVVILTFALLQFELSMAQLLSQARSLRCELFHLCILVDSLLELFLCEHNITSLKVSFGVLLV